MKQDKTIPDDKTEEDESEDMIPIEEEKNR